jgi:hypothetical protein
MGRNKNDYQRYLELKQELDIYEEELRDAQKVAQALKTKVREMQVKLGAYSEYEGIDADTVSRLNSALIMDALDNPATYDMGGSITLPMDSYMADENGYGSLDAWQKENFKYVATALKKSQLGMQDMLLQVTERVSTYSIEECDGFSCWSNKIIQSHPNYDDLSDNELIQLREIIYNFADYVQK